MKANDIWAPASDECPAPRKTRNAGIRVRQLECMRAFQTGHSWYEAYWYPEPQLRRPGTINRTLSKLVLLLQRWPKSLPSEPMAEPELASR
jgi:hypothetical protein